MKWGLAAVVVACLTLSCASEESGSDGSGTGGGSGLAGGSGTSMLRFWEYKSVDPSGNPINVGSRITGSRQLTDAQAAMMRDPTVVLGGWQPPAN